MKIGVIISSNDAETCWNALRYANFALGQKDEVKVFLTGKGVEYQKMMPYPLIYLFSIVT